ncbi:MAG: aminoacyl-tRNA hydrolase [Verrucomicrobia bacterium]|nr:aminoacyl-tRNA hydrolase [Verrucomicrobiota bacterium]
MKSLLSSPNAARPKDYLIIGLGNPGTSYEKTRHNVGFRAVRHFAKRHGIELRKAARMSAELGHGTVKGASVGLVLPLTYMNSSGEAVRECVQAYKVALEQVIVIVDDVAFPVGDLRLKEGGSSGGHNGLKSIEEHLGTSAYPRLRLGVGSPEGPQRGRGLADYVLGKFETAEEALLPQVFEKAADVLDCWIQEGIQTAMTKANTKGVI